MGVRQQVFTSEEFDKLDPKVRAKIDAGVAAGAAATALLELRQRLSSPALSDAIPGNLGPLILQSVIGPAAAHAKTTADAFKAIIDK
jgi:hypothetical protein